jgi:hypothetical protein
MILAADGVLVVSAECPQGALPPDLEEPIVRRVQELVLCILACLAFAAATCAADPQSSKPLCGRLTRHQGVPVLELWGTREQAGYAQGYLLAERIVRLLDEYVLSERVIRDPALYEALLLPGVRRQFVWSQADERELKAIGAGVRDKLGEENARSVKLGRPLCVEDLMVCNALADWHGVLCSTFSAWGALTADGGTITARNLDFPSTPSMERAQYVLIYRGDGESRAWAGVSWPGLIGVYTAMNRDGVTVAMHDAAGLAPSYLDGYTPRSLALRAALEAAEAKTFVEDVRRVFRSHRVMVGNNVHVSGPVLPGRLPAAVFEYDANQQDNGVTVRLPEPHAPELAEAIWCTNHLRLRREPIECDRYDRLSRGLAELRAAGGKLGPTSAMKLIGTVRGRTTLHSVCFVPDRRTMYVHIPAVTDKVVEFKLDDWLRRPLGEGAAAAGKGAQP